VFEEEDFQPLVYGFKLASDVPQAKDLALIKESEEDLMKEIKKCSPSSSSIEESQEMKVLNTQPFIISFRLLLQIYHFFDVGD
jgi:hypothetical protein